MKKFEISLKMGHPNRKMMLSKFVITEKPEIFELDEDQQKILGHDEVKKYMVVKEIKSSK